jgi:hypothetical protein
MYDSFGLGQHQQQAAVLTTYEYGHSVRRGMWIMRFMWILAPISCFFDLAAWDVRRD